MTDINMTTVSAEDEGDGVRVKLSFFARGFALLDAIRAVQYTINPSAGSAHVVNTTTPASVGDADVAPVQHEGSEGGDKPARRSRRAAGKAEPAAAEHDGVVEVGSGDLNADAPAPRRRRSATAAADAPAAETPAADVPGEADAAPAPRRRRAPTGGVNNGEGTDRAPADSAVRGADDRPAADAELKLTLVDLSKAASAAAEKITPAGVTEVLGAFNVTKLNDLPKEEWQDFVDVLVDRMEQADLEAQ